MTYGGLALRGKALALLLVATPALAEPLTIAAFGDSLTQGYGLIEQEGFVPQLRLWLAEHGDELGTEVTVINAGVSGDTTAGGLARVDWTLTPDVGAMIVALGGNDLLRGIDPAQSRANMRGILQAAQAHGVQVLLIGMQAPGNYGPAYKAEFDAIWPELSAEFDTLYVDSFFAGLGGADPAGLRDLFQADGIHPNAEGVRRIVAALGPEVQALIKKTR
ncbi:acyl-CoA thioesterase-1 [Thalassovita taeanensis]|uniref:Acyl-CoA thioesterase-1 n=2 Tax=Thalassovita taeanensis TaxID=657014 RepID=A0A1H9AMG9_9RHOB|nr:acyl-CoA thioesterase-1 [Thalassovita taeanensis]